MWLIERSLRKEKLISQNDESVYEHIPVVLRLKKNIAEVGRLIAKYRYNYSFDAFASEEDRQF